MDNFEQHVEKNPSRSELHNSVPNLAVTPTNDIAMRIAKLSPRKHGLFLQRLYASMSAVPVTRDRADSEIGPIPLLAIQRWFLTELEFGPPHYRNLHNVCCMVEINFPINHILLEESVKHILSHHLALRQRFFYTKSEWQSYIDPPSESIPVKFMDLSTISNTELRSSIESAAAAAQNTLDILRGPLLQIVLFDLGEGRSSRLLVIIHHLVADAVSLPIVLQDIMRAYSQLRQGERIVLSTVATSFRQWAERMDEYTQSAALQKELDYWLALPWRKVVALPKEFPGDNYTQISAPLRVSTVKTLSIAETTALLKWLTKRNGSTMLDILLTSLVQAYSSLTCVRTLLVYLVHHGRVSIFGDLNPSRTVGYLVVNCPAILDISEAKTSKGEFIAIREQLRNIPNQGIGHGLLRYVSRDRDVVDKLAILPYPEIMFNYLGSSIERTNYASFRPAIESVGETDKPIRVPGRMNLWASVNNNRLHLSGSMWEAIDNVDYGRNIDGLLQNWAQMMRLFISRL